MKKPILMIGLLLSISICLFQNTTASGYSSEEAGQPKLEEILEKCAEYCERLANSVLDFVCQEKITEKIYDYSPKSSGHVEMTDHEEITIKGLPSEIEKNVYIYDYQLIQKENRVRERRILVKENGKKKNEKDAQLKTKRFKHEHIVFGPVGLLSEFWQQNYKYKIIKRKRFKGDKVIVIEVTPVPYLKTDYLYGRIWVREGDFSIVKIEWDQKSIKNYELIEKAARRFKAEPVIKFYAEYAFEKNGIRFPSKYSVTETYIRRVGEKLTRSKTTVAYKDYKFFTVETKVKYKDE